MSRLDDELARALEDGEDSVSGQVQDLPPGGRRPEPPRRRSAGLLVALLVMGSSITALVLTSFRTAAVYSKGVDALLAEQDKLAGRNVRVEGTLVKGSLRKQEKPCEYRFQLERNGARLEVVYPQCVVPDTFRDVPYSDVNVTAEGTLGPGGPFQATQIMAKCPSKYEVEEGRPRHPDSIPLPNGSGASRAR